MNRLERLLDLVHVLQTSRRPVSLSELKDRFEDYAEGSDDAVRRKFERDKAELARIGVVLRYDGDEDDPGYSVDTEATYLPALQMSDAEHGLLATAARAALADPGFPHRAALRLALAKLGARAEGEAAVQIGLGVSDAPSGAAAVEILSGALAARKRVTMGYQKAGGETSTAREVDPYGVFLKRGAWYLVGHDHRSNEVRMFRVSRMRDVAVNPKRPATPDYEVPADFDFEAMMRDSPLSYRVHPPVRVAVRVDPEVAFLVERDWGAPDDDGVIRFDTTFLDFVLDQVLELGPRAALLEPEEGRRALREVFATITRAHEGQGGAGVLPQGTREGPSSAYVSSLSTHGSAAAEGSASAASAGSVSADSAGSASAGATGKRPAGAPQRGVSSRNEPLRSGAKETSKRVDTVDRDPGTVLQNRSSLPDDLARFLFLVPYVAARPKGVPVDELSAHLSCTRTALMTLVERCAFVGTPDGAPDEMVEIYLEGDRVHVALPQRFVRPPRFSVEETLSLLVALAPLRRASLPSLREQAQALSDRLVALAGERAAALAPLLESVTVHADGNERDDVMTTLEVAVREGAAVAADYYTATRDSFGRRTIRPVGLLQVRGDWYCVGDDGKTYKGERFRSATLVDGSERGPRPAPSSVSIDLDAVRARLERGELQGELTPVRVRERGEERRWPVASLAGIRRWVRARRGGAEVVGPEEARREVLDEARSLHSRYS